MIFNKKIWKKRSLLRYGTLFSFTDKYCKKLMLKINKLYYMMKLNFLNKCNHFLSNFFKVFKLF